MSEKILELANKEFSIVLEEVWGIQNPTGILEECIEKEEWFKGVVLSATFFEGIGAKVLLLHYKRQMKALNKRTLAETIKADKMIAEKIGDLSVNSILILLYALGIIEPSTYLKMVKVNKDRNDLVHRQSPFAKPEGKEARRTIEMAIKCLHKLMYELHPETKQFLLERKKKK